MEAPAAHLPEHTFAPHLPLQMRSACSTSLSRTNTCTRIPPKATLATLAVAHAVGDCSSGPRVASSLIFGRSRSCEFLKMSLRTANLLLDKLGLNICRFL